MHDTAYRHGRLFFELYWDEGFRRGIDLGSQDVNGSLRDHCPPTAHYVGLDMRPARGVDVVVAPGVPLPFESESIDFAVTSSCFEHDICFWDTFVELIRVIRPGGFLYLNAPSNAYFHRYPLDCWRFYPDAGVALVEWARRKGLHVEIAESFVAYSEAEDWCDFVAVFRKPDGSPLRRRGRIADYTRCMNIFDWGMTPGASLESESNHTPDTLVLRDFKDRVQAAEAGEVERRQQQLLTQAWELERMSLIQAQARAERVAEQLVGEHELVLSRERRRTERLGAELEQALQRVEKARLAIHRMEASAAWRLTAPFRRVEELVRRERP